MNVQFTEASFKNIYQNHINTLTQLRESHPNRCHRIMSTLYSAVQPPVMLYYILWSDILVFNCSSSARPRSLPPWLDLSKEDEP